MVASDDGNLMSLTVMGQQNVKNMPSGHINGEQSEWSTKGKIALLNYILYSSRIVNSWCHRRHFTYSNQRKQGMYSGRRIWQGVTSHALADCKHLTLTLTWKLNHYWLGGLPCKCHSPCIDSLWWLLDICSLNKLMMKSIYLELWFRNGSMRSLALLILKVCCIWIFFFEIV